MGFPILSTLVLVLLTVGIVYRKVNRIHISAMMLAFLIDIGMVLYLELNRAAVEQVVEGVHGLLAFHVAVSVLVVLLYIALIVTGMRLFKRITISTKLHRLLASVFVIGRLINYVTAFYVGS